MSRISSPHGAASAAQARGERVVVALAQVAPLDHQAHVVAVGASRVRFRGGDGARGARDAPLHPAHRRVKVRAHGHGRHAFAGVRARGDERDVQVDRVPAEGPAVRDGLTEVRPRRGGEVARRVRALARLDEPPEQKQTPRSAPLGESDF